MTTERLCAMLRDASADPYIPPAYSEALAEAAARLSRAEGTCVTCRYWRVFNDDEGTQEWGDCTDTTVSMEYADGSFHTSRAFGCREWEEAEPRRKTPEPPARDEWRKDGDVDREVEFKQESAAREEVRAMVDAVASIPPTLAPPDEPEPKDVMMAQCRAAQSAIDLGALMADRDTFMAYADRLRDELRQAREDNAGLSEQCNRWHETVNGYARDWISPTEWRLKATEAAALRARVARLTEALRSAADALGNLRLSADVHGEAMDKLTAKSAEEYVRAALAEGKEGT